MNSSAASVLRKLAQALFLLFIFSAVAPISYGHVKLVRSQPRAKATLKEAPKAVRLWFNYEVQSGFNTITVTDKSGRRVEQGAVTIAEENKRIGIELGELGPGTYTVAYKVLSTDQHTIRGKFSFTIKPAETETATTKPVAPATPQPAPAPAEAPAPKEAARPAIPETEPPPVEAAEAEANPTAGVMEEAGFSWRQSGLRGLGYLTMMALFGGFVFQRLVFRPALNRLAGVPATERATIESFAVRRFLLLAWLSIIGLIITALGSLILQVALVLDVSWPQALSLDLMTQVLAGTSYGPGWFVLVTNSILVALILWLITRHTARRSAAASQAASTTGTLTAGPSLLWWLGLIISSLLFLAPTLTGHAAAAANEHRLALPVNWLHLVVTGAWVGGLFHFALTRPTASADLAPLTRLRLVAEMIPRFTNVAIVGVILMVLTGVYNSWLHLPSVSALWTTNYGTTLLFKLLLVLPMLLLGGVNNAILRPRLARLAAEGETEPERLARNFGRAVKAEALLGLGVLGITAVLAFLPPAVKQPAVSHQQLESTAGSSAAMKR